MKLHLQKALCLITIIILFAFSIAGCNEDDKKNTKDDGFLKNNNPMPTIVIYLPDLPAPELREKVFDEISLRTRSLIGCNVIFKEGGDLGHRNYLDAEILFKNTKDIDAAVVLCDPVMLAQNGYIMDITDLLAEHAPDLKSNLKPEQLQQVKFLDRIYAIPPLSPGSQRLVAVLREDLAEKYDVKAIDTLEDYEALLDKVTQNESSNLYFKMCYDDILLFPQVEDYVYLDGGFVYKRADGNSKLIPWEETEQYRNILEALKRMSKKGLRFVDAPGQITTDTDQLASFITGWDTAIQNTRMLSTEGKYRIYPMYMENTSIAGTGLNPSLVVASKTAHPDLVLKFVELVHKNQEIYDLLMYGINDRDYELEDSRLKLKTNEKIFYGWNSVNAFKDYRFEREFSSDSEGIMDLWRDEVENRIDYPPTLGFKPQYDKIMLPDLIKRDFFLSRFVREPMSHEEILELTKILGVQKMLEETQKQLDNWKRK